MLKEAIKMLRDKYPDKEIAINQHPPGFDGVHLRCGGWQCKIDNTFLASASPVEIAIKIEHLLHLKEERFKQEYPGGVWEAGIWQKKVLKELLDAAPKPIIKETTKSVTEQWAEEWAKKHEGRTGKTEHIDP